MDKRLERKNKSYVEQYGLEKANYIKDNISKKLKGHVSNKKNKSFEELYGIEKSNKIKQKLRNASLKQFKNGMPEETKIKKSLVLKGRTYKDLFGKEKAEKLIFKKAKIRKNKSYEDYWNNKDKIQDFKERLKNNRLFKNYNEIYGEEKTQKILEKKKNCMSGLGKLSKDENKVLEELEQKLNIKIEKPYIFKRFTIDGYISKYKIAIEVDGSNHQSKKNKIYDNKRENIIIKELNCKFIRIFKKWFFRYPDYKQEIINKIREMM